MTTSTIKGQTNRLKVFAFVKQFMEEEEECPTGEEIAAATGISMTAALRHLHALRGADGLPMEVPVNLRRYRRRYGLDDAALYGHRTHRDLVSLFEENLAR